MEGSRSSRKSDRFSATKGQGRFADFNDLKKLIEGFPLGIVVGNYREGEVNDKGEVIRKTFLEINYVERRGREGEQRYERMYRVGEKSVRQRREIEKWKSEGRIREGHVNLEKYDHNPDNPIIDI